jgi:hypothetical protein
MMHLQIISAQLHWLSIATCMTAAREAERPTANPRVPRLLSCRDAVLLSLFLTR